VTGDERLRELLARADRGKLIGTDLLEQLEASAKIAECIATITVAAITALTAPDELRAELLGSIVGDARGAMGQLEVIASGLVRVGELLNGDATQLAREVGEATGEEVAS